jgi:hypothetical protein
MLLGWVLDLICRCAHEVVMRQLVCDHDLFDLSMLDNRDAVAHREQLVMVLTNKDNRLSGFGECIHQFVNGDFGADIDALRRFIKNQNAGI